MKFLIILAGLLTHLVVFAQDSKQFNDWVVGCDNGHDCTAIGLAARKAPVGEGFIKITRAGSVAAVPVITIILDPSIATSGAILSLVFSPGATKMQTEPLLANKKYLKAGLSPQVTTEFMNALSNSTLVSIQVASADASNIKAMKEIKISLTGVIAALRYMDEQQDRTGTVSALFKPGNQPASTLAAPPDIPQLEAKQMKMLHGELPPLPPSLTPYKATTDACSGDDAPRAVVARLSEAATLWGLCKSVADYNVDYAFYIVEDGQAKLASFEVPPGTPDLHGVLTNPDISNEDRILSSFKMGNRGGDCGVLREWIWDGSQFRLFSYRKMTDCRGLYDTTDWPTLYKAKK